MTTRNFAGTVAMAGMLLWGAALPARAAQQQPAGAPPPAVNQAHQVQLAVPFGTVAGQLVLSGHNLIFIDSLQARNSFTVSRDRIRNGSVENGVLSLDLTNPVTTVAGEQSTLHLRFANPADAQNVLMWLHSTPAPQVRTDGEAEQPSTLSFQVKHNHFIGSDRGRLLITPSQVIYESVTDVNASRQWNLSDIKQVKHSGPYKLTIVPFTGDKYDFELLGRGMSPDQYRTLVNRVTGARLPAQQ